MRAKKTDIRNKIIFAAVSAVIAAGICILPFMFSKADEEETEGNYSHFDFFDITSSYSSVLYNSENGMPTSEANAIVQTPDGFIWIGGYSGLIRYDGSDFTRYEANTGIASVICLYVDSSERLWIGTNDSGVAYMEKGEVEFFTTDDGIRASSVRALAEDDAGNMLIATTAGLNYITPDGDVEFIDDESINDKYIVGLTKADDGKIYGITTAGDMFIVDNLEVTDFFGAGSLVGEHTVSCVCPDNGTIYLGTEENAVFKGTLGGGFEQIIVDPLYTITKIERVDDYLLMISDNGVGVLSDDGNFKKLDNLEMTNSIDDMMVDYEGDLWFASSRQGIMKVVENRFTDITMIAGLDEMVINSTCVSEGIIYLGTDTGIYALDEQYNLIENEVTKAAGENRTRAILKDSEGNLWFGTYGDTALMEYTTDHQIVCFTEDDGMLSNKVRDVFEGSDGKIYASASSGVNVIEDGKVTDEVYDADTGLVNSSILTIAEDGDGNLYLGSDGGGIYVFDKDKNLTHIGQDEGLKSDVILRIKYDEERDMMWVITSNTLAYIKDGETTTINNFPYSNNLDLFINSLGEAWVIGSGGIYRLSVDELLEDSEEMDYVLYDSKRGLPYVLTANSRNYVSEDGTLYMSCSSGLATINIEEPFADNDRVMLTIPYVACDGVYYYIDDDTNTVTIPADTVRLTIYGYVLSYSFDFPKVGYTLSGLDSEMVTVNIDELTALSYTNLSGGTYNFKLSVINVATQEVEKSLVVTVIKEKSFYEHWWFQAMMVLLAILLMFLVLRIIYKAKTRQLLRQRERDRRILGQIISAFARIIDAKDQYTRGHSFRVAKYSEAIAKGMGMSDDEVADIYNIAMLHDVGKTGIPIAILNKPGKLTDEEYHTIQSHTTIGKTVLSEITDFPELALGAAYHHEKWNGKGYPEGLEGDNIPKVAQIIAVADCFDAMYSTRPYRKQMKLEDVIAEIKRCEGTQFNPDIAEVFIKLIEDGKIDFDQINKETEDAFRDDEDNGNSED